MAKKIVAALFLIAAIAAFLTIREEGRDKAFGGAFAPLESVRAGDGAGHEPLAGVAIGDPSPTGGGTDYEPMVDRVKSRVNGAMQQSVRRSSR